MLTVVAPLPFLSMLAPIYRDGRGPEANGMLSQVQEFVFFFY